MQRIIARVNRMEEGNSAYRQFADPETYNPIRGEEVGDEGHGRDLIYTVEISDGFVGLERFAEQDNVLYVEPDLRAYGIPEDLPPRLAEVQDDEAAIPELEVRNYIGQGKLFSQLEIDGTGVPHPHGVEVAVLDTGLDHIWSERLGDRLTQHEQFTDENHPAILPEGVGHFHGTHCAGLIAADNKIRLNIAQVLGDDGSGYNSWITNGLYWAVRNGCRVASLSLGGGSFSTAMDDAVNYARSRGCLVVAAMGNDGRYLKSYPAAYLGATAILASHYTDAMRANFSNYGEWGFLTTEGVSVLSWVLSGVLGRASGTSPATPLAARGLALLIGRYGGPAQVLKTVGATAADTPEPVLEEGHGRLHTRYAAEELERSAS